MVECCVSVLGESSGRSDHAHHWFAEHTLITAFMNIHESTFELVSNTSIHPYIILYTLYM